MHLMSTFLSMFRIYMYHFVLGREFTAHAQYNATHVTISCEYSSFRLSTDGIHIDNGNVTLATCRWASQKHHCSDGTTGKNLSPLESDIIDQLLIITSLTGIQSYEDVYKGK
jgi:hypothetical protein